jgi:hypothetical protein
MFEDVGNRKDEEIKDSVNTPGECPNCKIRKLTGVHNQKCVQVLPYVQSSKWKLQDWKSHLRLQHNQLMIPNFWFKKVLFY